MISIKLLRVFAVGAVILILQMSLASFIEIYSARPDLLLIFSLLISNKHGRYAGLAAGFITGFAQDVISIGFLGVTAFSASTVAFWFGVWNERRETRLQPLSWSIVVIICYLIQGFLVSIFILQEAGCPYPHI